MESKVIDPNSVQSQFVSLNRDRETLRTSTQHAERERRREEILLQNLREAHKGLTEKLRLAHATLGSENKKRQLLTDEEKRFKRVTVEDKHNLFELNRRLKGMVEEEKLQKKNFVKEMRLLNDELDRALKQNEERKIMKYITVNNVQFLIDTRVQDEMTKDEGSGSPPAPDGGDDMNAILHSKWRVFFEKLNTSLDILKETTSKLESEQVIKNDHEEERSVLRATMMKEGHATDNTGQPFGEMELDELERLWDETYESETEEPVTNENQYPENSQNDGDYQYLQHDDESRYSQKQAEQQQPINMDLFYGNTNDGDDESTITMRDSLQPYGDKMLI